MSYERSLIHPKESIINAIRTINGNPYKVAIVVDENDCPLGTITDGDIRRALLKGFQMDHSVDDIMHKDFTSASIHDDVLHIDHLMRKHVIRHVPILDDNGKIVDIRLKEKTVGATETDHWVVIMAGGLGQRLLPLTETCPKPMLEINGRPILERIIIDLRKAGFKNFYIAVNYKSDVIERYFADGQAIDVNINYLREEKRLGTAGALSLIPQRPRKSVIVMNGDLLTTVDFRRLIDYHEEHSGAITVCVSEFDFKVPYGVVQVDNQKMVKLEEKPVQKVFVNAGIYVLDPSVLGQIPTGEYFDMTRLINKRIAAGDLPSVFPIHERWLDIGCPEDFEKANDIFEN